MNIPCITEFRGKYFFLSNFYPSEIKFDGHIYPTVEHAYQAAKTLNRKKRAWIRKAKTPAIAKKRGRRVKLKSNWEEDKIQVMEMLISMKFSSHKVLAQKLRDTSGQILIEGNTWDDREWGMVEDAGGEWHGKNKLGVILMMIRSMLE